MLDACVRAVRIGSLVASQAQRACIDTAANKATKPDSSPVTVGDFAVQACVSHILSQSYPHIKLLAEEDDENFRRLPADTQLEIVHRVNEALPELKADVAKVAELIGRGSFGKTTGDVPPCFVLDPIDGTKGFLRGEQYAVCLGFLEENGTASIGVLGCPNMPSSFFSTEGEKESAKGFLFEARLGAGTRMRKLFLDDASDADPILHEWTKSSSSILPPSQLRFAESFEKSHTAGRLNELLFKAFDVDERTILRIDSQVKFAAVARGDVQVYFRFTGFDICTWDVLPGYVVITEAGGRVTDKRGRPITLNAGRTIRGTSVITTGPGLAHVHDRILSLIPKDEA